MINIPAHKQTSPDKAPGQVVCQPVWPHKTSGQIVNDVTLADYIARKEKAYQPKMSFEQWWSCHAMYLDKYAEQDFRNCWNTAQENM